MSAEAKLVLGAGAAVAAGVVAVGALTSTDIPAGKIGVYRESAQLGSPIHQVEAGNYWFASLRFPGMSIVTPGEERHDQFTVPITPGMFNKMKESAQGGLFLRVIPGLGAAIKGAKTHHIEFEFQVRYKVPDGAKLVDFLERSGSTNFKDDGIERIAKLALDDKESALKAKVIEPKVADLEKAVADELAAHLHLDNAEVKILKVTKFTKTDEDHARERRFKQDAAVSIIGEVVYAATARLF
jgi:hypothetical protein